MKAAASTVADILRVNHAGECGAIQIYAGQRALARWRASDLIPFLDRAMHDEIGHRREFARLMKERGIIPCAVLRLWGVGGWALGVATGLLGRSAILACTVAVERTVHRHLDQQLVWLADREAAIWSAIKLIQIEEMAHLKDAQQKAPRMKGVMVVLDQAIGSATAVLIWLSTYGASSRMAGRIQQDR